MRRVLSNVASALGRICCLLLVAHAASAEVVRIEITRQDGAGTHERVIARVHYAIDPRLPANRAIADLDRAPTNTQGKVEFSGDLLMFVPKDAASARGSVFLEVVNRGRDQSLGLMSGASQRDLSPESWVLGDHFLLREGFTVAFLGWQFDVGPSQGLTFQAPIAPVEGVVRASYVESVPGRRRTDFSVSYCSPPQDQKTAALTFRTRIDATPQTLPRDAWQFAADGCSVHVPDGLEVGLYEVIYTAKGSPIAGLGLAAVRDFASYLRHVPAGAVLRERPAAVQRVIGFGYSQSGRFLREFVRDGFNADERGRAAFDALMISAAGAGGGSFNHRFAMPGQAGNSVLSVLRPVDLPPFADEGLLAQARSARVTPKIFYTFSSTEYWARAGSLTHTTEDGKRDVPLAATSRLYFLAGTPHASGALQPMTGPGQAGEPYANFAQQRWVLRALLLALDDWTRGTAPPASQYPSIARGELVPRADVRFPALPRLQLPGYMPQVWRMDFGEGYETTRVITNEPPRLGAAFQVLVPQVNDDGNDVAGIRMPEVSVPLGTYTAWSVPYPQLSGLGYLSGLSGAFVPFAATRDGRERKGDTRLSIEERYRGKQDYLDRVKRSVADLVRARFMLAGDADAVLKRAEDVWRAVVDGN
jgi:hypothetical protein